MSDTVCHIVMWDVAGQGKDEKSVAIRRIKEEFEALRDQIPGMTKLEVGTDVSGASYACDMVLVTEFESQEALSAYGQHPAHLAARERLDGLRIARHQVDYILRT